jgi:hypothetical protein
MKWATFARPDRVVEVDAEPVEQEALNVRFESIGLRVDEPTDLPAHLLRRCKLVRIGRA